ncbi:hypothetical protein VPH35_094225 [Triticum aestivum]
MGRAVATISPLQMVFLRRPATGNLASADGHCCSTPFSSCLSPPPRRSPAAPPVTRLAARTVTPRICLHLAPPPLAAGHDREPNLREEGPRAAQRKRRQLWLCPRRSKGARAFPGVGSIPLPRRGVHAPLPEPGIQELLSAHGDLLCAAPPLFLRIAA